MMIKVNGTVTANVLSLMLMFSSVCVSQQSANNAGSVLSAISKSEQIDELMSHYSNYGKFNGAVLVAEKGDVVFKNGYGLANMDWDIPNDVDTKFRLASVTKQFTAMLTMQLVAEKKLKLDGVIADYLPAYSNEYGDQVTIHQLLTHTGGIPNYTNFPSYRDLMKESKTPMELVAVFADSTLQFVPGERFSYSNSGYVLLGAIIEAVTEKSLPDVLQEKILEPLGMNDTGFEKKGEVLKNRATGYDRQGITYTLAYPIDMSVAYAAGGMYSTVEDMFLWDQALYTSKLLPRKEMDLIFQQHIPAWGKHYGYGWLVGELSLGTSGDLLPIVEHDGVINGFRSLIIRFPEDQSSIVLLHNAGGAALYDIAQSIAAILYGKTYDLPKRSIANALLAKIEHDGIAAGRVFYESIRKDSTYYLDEEEMNVASYELLKAGKGEDALEVLQLAITAFPNAFNLYDSYGEILGTLGRTEESIINYKKSLQLNPKNENAVQMLAKVGVDVDPRSFYLLKTESSWTSEIFTFPLRFAPDLGYVGTEEAHFPKGWRKPDNPEFWSYVFAWNIDQGQQLSAEQLEQDMQIYFDGLSAVVNRNKDKVLPKSAAEMMLVTSDRAAMAFSGTIDIFDSFVTNEPMRLFVKAEKHYCKQSNKSVLFFRFSPKGQDHEIWDTLEKIKLGSDHCED